MSGKIIDSFAGKEEFDVGNNSYSGFFLGALEKEGFDISRLPFSLKVLLENLLRNEDGRRVTKNDITALANWKPENKVEQEISFMPARVLMQDFTGIPAIADLAAMRDAISEMGGDPSKINPLQPADLIIDHSVQIDRFGDHEAFDFNMKKEFERNEERYAFLRWGQKAFTNFRVVPPDTGIIHQINLEYLGQVIFQGSEGKLVYPDTLVGTDSHTTMINALGIIGWGVGGIEAEAAMLGLPISMLIPEVIGVKLSGTLKEGVTATDLVLTITNTLRGVNVVGKFVEFFGPGLENLNLADRSVISNMAPEYGATVGFFPVDAETISFLRFSNRDTDSVDMVEAYTKKQGMFRTADTPDPHFTKIVEVDLSQIEPSIAGPKRPQELLKLSEVKSSYRKTVTSLLENECSNVDADNIKAWIDEASNKVKQTKTIEDRPANDSLGELLKTVKSDELTMKHGQVVIASITSCTNTSNPGVMVAAGLLAKKAVALGLSTKPWVKTSLAPGSKVVTEYLNALGLMEPLEKLNFHLVGYGCATCIGNSGPLNDDVTKGIKDGDLIVGSVLSGNRNFEGRINPLTRINYLASPPLVVAYAIAGSLDIDLFNEPLGYDKDKNPVYMKDIWPSNKEVNEAIANNLKPKMFKDVYSTVFEGDKNWQNLATPEGQIYNWSEKSTYIKKPPFFKDMEPTPAPLQDIGSARVLALLGNSVTTDHISPAGAIPVDSPAGKYLISIGVKEENFNSFGSRRGNHDVMVRGTFGNIRLKNLLTPNREGNFTKHLPAQMETSIYEAAQLYKKDNVSLIVIAGKEYGTGSSRDWAAKGTQLLGVKAVIAESYERIHRSNLVGMGILPLQFADGEGREALKLTGFESYSINGIADNLTTGKLINIVATSDDGSTKEFTVKTRIDTPEELLYFKHGGILKYVLRQLV